jgi:hypothetical protein
MAGGQDDVVATLEIARNVTPGGPITDNQHGAGWNLPGMLVVLRRELLHVWG